MVWSPLGTLSTYNISIPHQRQFPVNTSSGRAVSLCFAFHCQLQFQMFLSLRHSQPFPLPSRRCRAPLLKPGEPEAWSGTFQQQMQILTQSSDMRPGREPPGGRQEPEVKKHESSEGSCRDREQGPGSPRQTRSQPPRLVGLIASTEGSGSEPADTFSLCHHHFSFLVMFESKFLSPASNGAFAKVTSTSLCSMHL